MTDNLSRLREKLQSVEARIKDGLAQHESEQEADYVRYIDECIKERKASEDLEIETLKKDQKWQQLFDDPDWKQLVMLRDEIRDEKAAACREWKGRAWHFLTVDEQRKVSEVQAPFDFEIARIEKLMVDMQEARGLVEYVNLAQHDKEVSSLSDLLQNIRNYQTVLEMLGYVGQGRNDSVINRVDSYRQAAMRLRLQKLGMNELLPRHDNPSEELRNLEAWAEAGMRIGSLQEQEVIPISQGLKDYIAEYEDRRSSDDASNRLRNLRKIFDLAVEKLDVIPDTELSSTAQPFVEECADALLAFADWFGEQSPDDLPVLGNAYRITYAMTGLSGVIDWVALHWSVPFANEIEQEAGALLLQAEEFDEAVVQVFKLPSESCDLRLQRKILPDHICDDFEKRIAEISAMARRLGSRLRRVAVWASGGHLQKTSDKHSTSCSNALGSVCPAVVLGEKGMPCKVMNVDKPKLTEARYDVVKALLDAGKEGLTKDALEAVRPSARRILDDLREDPDWAGVILMAGQTNGRYRIKS